MNSILQKNSSKFRVTPMSYILQKLTMENNIDTKPEDIIELLKENNLFFLSDDFARMALVKAKHDKIIDDYDDICVDSFATMYATNKFHNTTNQNIKNSKYIEYVCRIQRMLNDHLEKFRCDYDNIKSYPLTHVTKRFEFSAAHQIYGYNGLCANVHGHTWFLEVTLVDTVHDSSGFVMDFKDLKKHVNEMILSELDHHMINDVVTPLLRPTAETLLPYIYFKLFYYDNKNEFLPISNIRLYESPDSWADLKFTDLMRSNFFEIPTYLKMIASIGNEIEDYV